MQRTTKSDLLSSNKFWLWGNTQTLHLALPLGPAIPPSNTGGKSTSV